MSVRAPVASDGDFHDLLAAALRVSDALRRPGPRGEDRHELRLPTAEVEAFQELCHELWLAYGDGAG